MIMQKWEDLPCNSHSKKYRQVIGNCQIKRNNEDRDDGPINKIDRPLPVKRRKNNGTPSESDEGNYEKSVIDATEGKSSNT